jgi:glutamate/tyrosine decarboxylase-like PLP-dependent enzyme
MSIIPHGAATERAALERATIHAFAYLDALDDLPVAAPAGVAEMRARLLEPLPETGCTPATAIDDLVARVAPGLVNTAGPRFFGWVNGGALPAAVAADWLTAAWDQNAVMAAGSPAASVIEEVAGAWLLDLLGLPAEASFAFVTGCQAAHVTCLAAARHHLLARAGWDVEQDGLFGAPPIRILTSESHHGSVERAARLIGFGRRAITRLPVDPDGRLAPETLTGALDAAPDAPTIVLLQAADLNIGACDPYNTLIPLAQTAGAWVHIDGAFGLWAAASPHFRHLVAGIDRADSWATDGHKWLNVPYDCGYAFTRHPEAHRAALSHRADYITYDGDARDQCDWTPEWSRRARGFATWAAIRSLGRDGVAAMIEGCCDVAAALYRGISALPGVEPLWEPTLNQGLVRFPDPRPGATAVDHDARTDAITAAICASGDALFSATTWRGMRAMRLSSTNWRTGPADVALSITAVERALAGT